MPDRAPCYIIHTNHFHNEHKSCRILSLATVNIDSENSCEMANDIKEYTWSHLDTLILQTWTYWEDALSKYSHMFKTSTTYTLMGEGGIENVAQRYLKSSVKV